MADLTDLDSPAPSGYVADYGHPMAMAEALLRQVDPDSPLLAERADAPDSNSGPSGGEGSTPSQGTVLVADDGSTAAVVVDGHRLPEIPHRVLSARVMPDDRHFHVADLVGEGFYVEGVRMKRAVCRTCGIDLEARRA